jgi:hypothetical protein
VYNLQAPCICESYNPKKNLYNFKSLMNLLDDQRDLDTILFLALNKWLERTGEQGVDRRPSIGELEIPNESREDDLVLEERYDSMSEISHPT